LFMHLLPLKMRKPRGIILNIAAIAAKGDGGTSAICGSHGSSRLSAHTDLAVTLQAEILTITAASAKIFSNTRQFLDYMAIVTC